MDKNKNRFKEDKPQERWTTDYYEAAFLKCCNTMMLSALRQNIEQFKKLIDEVLESGKDIQFKGIQDTDYPDQKKFVFQGWDKVNDELALAWINCRAVVEPQMYALALTQLREQVKQKKKEG